MKDLPPLGRLSDEEKNALIKAQWQGLQKLRAEIEKLKEKRVKKIARNSSLPPAKGFKPNQSKTESIQKVRQGSVGRIGGGRELRPVARASRDSPSEELSVVPTVERR